MDLRLLGWAQVELSGMEGDAGCVAIVDATGLNSTCWRHLLTAASPDDRRLMLVIGIDTSTARTRLLIEGFGDVAAHGISLEELQVRAGRLVELAAWIPRRRVLAELELDLLGRDATFMGKPLNLHPREFALLWRLAAVPGETVSKQALVQDVWRLDVSPDSNSVAVHLSRTRAKLAAGGLKGLLETVGGGYRLRCSVLQKCRPAIWRRYSPAASLAIPSESMHL
jgi:DNA-binding response OmpR family regulator